MIIRFFSSLSIAFCLSTGMAAQPTTIKDASATTDKFATLLNYIERLYVDSVNAEELTEKAIIALLQQLDPHSLYFTAEDLKESNEPLQGSFEGIGVQFQILRDTIYVISPIVDGPSEKLGIMAGDKIVTIEGKNVAGIGIANNDVMTQLRGPKGTKVSVGIKRKNVRDLLNYDIIRDKIPIFSIDASYMATPEIGYIKVSRFAKTTTEELRKALTDLKGEGMKDLILDLQGNGGGLLNSAIEMADEFLGSDRLLVYTEGRAFPKEEYHAKNVGLFEKGRLIVLVDEGSASASEIVSGAIQDWDRGLIVGRRSFGKGLVQRPVPLPDGSAVRLTVQKYYTPAGRCIQKSYQEGVDEYYKDRQARWESGEFFHEDSIHVPDSLKYFTNIKKRIVYGGGGIIPDVFVAADTSANSAYFSELLRTNVNNNYVVNFVDKNRADLMMKYPSLEIFKKSFDITDDMMKDLIDMAEKEKIKFNAEEFHRSESVIRLRTKALIARNLYESAAFFEVINPLNEAFIAAIAALENGQFEKMKLAYNDF